jgi:preprotein translocase subunit SecY
MSEEQEKPKQKWNKNWPGVLFVLFLVCLIAFAIISATRGQNEVMITYSYDTAREQIQNAVTAYSVNNSGAIPVLNGTYSMTNCSNCHVVNMSALLAANGGTLRAVPSGVYANATDSNDNCGSNASLGCKNGSSYIWIVDTNGTTYSYCAGAKCQTNNSGYQGVWP